ncbi:endonuclease/exonuclease/phosphatase family protein [Roseivivax sediminis]|uniref:Metal-dependent hydrolase, endonuclease/exonuclease/phosphatase family n=1 Tax=Roseivivax sediminis TaxID=936889 RepID=A0A1I1V9D4_9RHOB|nr:endonuclease/exonuclease/phosphatase family protein [Roseivivax sediminis]SFD79597.1 Metal-dependent hydrolase, endonuclease/exonuclease/phosphatase family [Roseivivax sediminis]
MDLKIASYNIRKALGIDRKRSPERILSVINGMGADVVLLQEADHRLGPRRAALPHSLIARETDYSVADLAVSEVSLGWHGNAILVRKDLPVTATERFDLPGLEPRGAVMVRIEGLHVVGTHLGLIRRWRQLQMQAILDHLGDRAATCLIGGDFNEWSRRAGFAPWASDLELVSPGPSFHSARPLGRLDRFAHGPGLSLHATGVENHGAARRASDHLPVWCAVRTHSADRPE